MSCVMLIALVLMALLFIGVVALLYWILRAVFGGSEGMPGD